MPSAHMVASLCTRVVGRLLLSDQCEALQFSLGIEMMSLCWLDPGMTVRDPGGRNPAIARAL